MNTTNRTLLVFLLFISISILLLSSCKKTEDVPSDPVITSMDDLKAPDGFTFSTSQGVGIEVRMLDNEDSPVRGMRVDVYTSDPDEGGHLMVAGITDDQGYFKVDYRIPAYQSSVVVGTRAIGFPNRTTVNVSAGQIRCTLGGKTTPNRYKSGGDAFYKSTNTVYYPMGTYNSLGVPNYLTPTNDVVNAAMLNDINSTLPEYFSAPVNRPDYFISTNQRNVTLTQACNVWVTFVHEGAGYKNVLGYYKYNANNPPANINAVDTVRIIFPNVSFTNSGGGLNSGNRVYLGQFAPGTTLAWMLIADGYRNGVVTNGNWRFFSDNQLNPEANTSVRQHAIFCNDIGRGKFLLGFEDIKREGSGCDNDFNDAIFYVSADPIQSVNTSNIPMPNYTQPDSDSDGISNAFDDYPDNPSKAFNNYYPSENSDGTLSFEDLWPDKGDYDMNDVVIDYNFNQVTNGQNKVVSITGAMTLRAMGAGYRNGFGIQLPISPTQVTSAAGMHLTDNYITNSANGTESGQSKATVIVFDNGYTVLEKPASDPYTGVNTSLGCTYVSPVTMNINITLSAPVSLSVLGTPPYNPFVIVNKTRGREIHLVNKPPTDLADADFFGTNDDTSIPGGTRYYTTANNLPWAFDIIDQFDYPIEKKPILDGYTKFAPWTTSGGAVNFDWFVPNPGYRNSQYIFTAP
jgi:LruC domain-containing protein